MQLITGQLKIFAGTLKFAAALTLETFKKIAHALEAVLKDEKNFEHTEETPLKFSPEGLKKLKSIEGYDFSKQSDMDAVFKRLTTVLELASKIERPEQAALALLYKNLGPGSKWFRRDFKNKKFNEARLIAEDTLNFAEELADKEPEKKSPLTLKDVSEMKEHGVLAR